MIEKQPTQINLRWVAYMALIMIYSTQVVRDCLSASIFTVVLLSYAGILQNKPTALLIQVILLAETVLKVAVRNTVAQKIGLDMRCINGVLNWEVRPDTCLWAGVNIFGVVMAFRALFANGEPATKKWGPLMTQIMVYILPILLYSFSLMTQELGLKMAWAGIACLQILQVFPLFTHCLCCALTTFYFYLRDDIPQYQIATLPTAQTHNIVSTCLLLMLILINVYSSPHPYYKQHPDKQLDPETKTRKVLFVRRQIQEEHSKHRLTSKIVMALTVGVCLVTTAPGNIFLLFAVFSNLPAYKPKRFYFLMGVGLMICMLL